MCHIMYDMHYQTLYFIPIMDLITIHFPILPATPIKNFIKFNHILTVTVRLSALAPTLAEAAAMGNELNVSFLPNASGGGNNWDLTNTVSTYFPTSYVLSSIFIEIGISKYVHSTELYFNININISNSCFNAI